MVLHGLGGFLGLTVQNLFADSKMLFVYKCAVDRIVIYRFDFEPQIMIQNQACLARKPSVVGCVSDQTVKLMVNAVEQTAVQGREILFQFPPDSP